MFSLYLGESGFQNPKPPKPQTLTFNHKLQEEKNHGLKEGLLFSLGTLRSVVSGRPKHTNRFVAY
jgi:hypothetical protein